MLIPQWILVKKIAAASLLFLLVFIHIEKTFHKHEKQITCNKEQGFSKTSNAGSCSICDFQLARDVTVPTYPAIEPTIYYLSVDFVFQPADFYSSSTSFSSDRAPPVC